MTARWLLLFGAVLLLGAAERPAPPKPLPPAEAVKQGRELVTRLLAQQPARDVTNTGVLKIRDADRRRSEVPVKFEIVAGETHWTSRYQAGPAGTNATELTVVHTPDQPNDYRLVRNDRTQSLAGDETMIPFAGSDFWVADLGLEFLHWPDQRLLRKEMRRGQSCDVLQSLNPRPAPGAYARVVSWIDIDTGGIIYAEAYDERGKVLKEFLPKSIKKVHGEWQLQEMDMDNRQTGSSTRIEFNLDRD